MFNWENSVGTPRFDAFGTILQDEAVICGGSNNRLDDVKGCMVIGNSKNTLKLLEKRTMASGVQLDQKTLWITGGSGDGGNSGETTTELISFGKPPINGTKLPFGINRHSMIKVDQKTIYIIGGTNGQRVLAPAVANGMMIFTFSHSTTTWIIDPTNDFDMKQGPSMNVERPSDPTSAKMAINGTIFIVVAGGTSYLCPYKKSVELLNTSLPDQGWMYGKKNSKLPTYH